MAEKSFGGSKNTSKNFFWDFSSYISIHKKKVLQGRPSWHGSYTCWPGYPDLVLLNQLPVEDKVFVLADLFMMRSNTNNNYTFTISY